MRATVVNGLPGSASVGEGGVNGLAPTEVVVFTGDRDSPVSRNEEKAVIKYFYHGTSEAAAAAAPAVATGTGPGAPALPKCPPPKIVVEKLAEANGQVGSEVMVDTDGWSDDSLANAPAAFRFNIRNTECTAATSITLVDSLPKGFEVTSVQQLVTSPFPWGYAFVLPPITTIVMLLMVPGWDSMYPIDDIKYDVKKVDDRKVLILKATAENHPLVQGGSFVIRVNGVVDARGTAK